MSERFRVLAPASTSNLGSGFDTLSAALALHLEVDVEPGREPGLHWLAGWDSEEENILDRALRVALEAFGRPLPALNLRMRNPIPLKRGLGSSGAAIVAGVKIAERVCGVHLSPEEILEIAYPLEGHPDNLTASLLGGWALSRIVDGKVKAERLEATLRCRFVVAVPEVEVSTQKARAILPDRYSLKEAVFNLQRCALWVHALHAGRGDLIREAVQDALHQSYRARLVPGMQEVLNGEGLKDHLRRALLGVSISGSGSSLIALTEAQADGKAIGEWMVSQLGRAGTPARHLTLDLDPQGARITEPGLSG